MTAGAHDAGGGFGRSAGSELVKGLAVLAVVIVVGVLLMVKGLDDNEAVAAGDTDTTTTTAAAPDDSTEETDTSGSTDETTITTLAPAEDATDTTLGVPRDPSEVVVLSVNGTEPTVAGAAGRGRDIVAQQNYATASPANADRKGPSAIFFVEGFESEARAVAAVFGVDPAAVVQPYSADTSPVDDIRGAQVIVLIGNDGVITV